MQLLFAPTQLTTVKQTHGVNVYRTIQYVHTVMYSILQYTVQYSKVCTVRYSINVRWYSTYTVLYLYVLSIQCCTGLRPLVSFYLYSTVCVDVQYVQYVQVTHTNTAFFTTGDTLCTKSKFFFILYCTIRTVFRICAFSQLTVHTVLTTFVG